MNTLFLIGNGFDLAHGHKTKYSDFIKWYLNNIVEEFQKNKYFKDPLVEIPQNPIRVNFRGREIDSLIEFINSNHCHYLEHFFERILLCIQDAKWVDLEEEYYLELKKVANDFRIKEINSSGDIERVSNLNKAFCHLKDELIKYLKNNKFAFIKSESVSKTIQDEIIYTHKEKSKYLIKNTDNENIKPNRKKEDEKPEILYLNFNYTKLIMHYMPPNQIVFPPDLPPSEFHTLVNIHGDLNEPENPIIFGYGDEIDADYEGIENLNKNEFLKHIKSFGYLKTDYYKKLTRFIKSGIPYRVVILGHSCGISDRVLLNAIFESENCKEIKIYYYDWGKGNDFTEKTQNISRHFHKEKKESMREKIVSFDKSSPLA